MQEPNDPDATPAQPAEEIPDWVHKHMLEDAADAAAADAAAEDAAEAGADQPSAETLVERHKARRLASRRLIDLTKEDAAGAEAPAEQDVPAVDDARTQEEQGLPAPVELPLDASTPDATLPETPTLETPVLDTPAEETLLHKVRAFPHEAWQEVHTRWTWIVVRVRTARASAAARRAQARQTTEGEPVPQEGPIPQVVLPSRMAQVQSGAAKTWYFVRPVLWRGRVGPAFWTVASLLSLTVNIILIVILILLGRQLFFLKNTLISEKLINGLYNNFALMDQAHIQTTITVSDTIQVKDTIQVNDTIPVVFDLPLTQNTVVVLTKDTPVRNATIYLNGAAVPLDLDLREGTELSIKLDMSVPVNTTVPVVLTVPVDLTVPVNLTVPVDIPLNQTQLHQPFVGLQRVVSPYRQLLGEVPDSWGAVCTGPLKFICTVLRFK